MSVSWRLAIGELREHKRIYAIIVVVISLTMTSFMLENAYLNYMMQVVDDTTKLITGDILVATEDTTLRDLYGSERELSDAGRIARQIEKELSGYKTSIRVTSAGAYLLSGDRETVDACTIQGIDPYSDVKASEIKNKLVEGNFFKEDDSSILRGHTPLFIKIKGPGDMPDLTYGSGQRPLKDEEPYPLIIGATATKIHPLLKVGKTFSITLGISGKETSYATVTVKVIGLYESGTPTLDAMVWFMHIDSLREIKGYGTITGKDWYIPGVGTFRGFNPIEIDRTRGDAVLVTAPEPAHRLNLIGYSEEVKNVVTSVVPYNTQLFSWHDFLIFIAGSMQDVVTILLWGSIVVTLLLCGAAIKYVMDSIILRKTREIGSLKAFGARDRVIFKIFLFQGLFIGFIAGILGIFISFMVMYLVNWYGFTVEFIAGTQLQIGFIINWLTILVAIFLPIMLTILAATIPAKKAAILSPVEALRRGELSL